MCISGSYVKLETPKNYREVLEFAQKSFCSLLGKESTACCAKIQNLDRERLFWAGEATKTLEANPLQKPTEAPVPNSSSLASKKIDWISFGLNTAMIALTCQGLGFLLSQVVAINAPLIIVCSLVIGVVYTFFNPPAPSTAKATLKEATSPIADDVKIRAEAELNWLNMKIKWIEAKLKEAHVAIGEECVVTEAAGEEFADNDIEDTGVDDDDVQMEPGPAQPELEVPAEEGSVALVEETLEAYRARIGKEILELTTLQAYLKAIVNQRYA